MKRGAYAVYLQPSGKQLTLEHTTLLNEYSQLYQITGLLLQMLRQIRC